MDLIFVENGNVDLIKQAILAHAGIVAPVQPRTFTATITRVSPGGFAITFDRKVPPYDFANLVGWLNEPPGIEQVSHCMGWYRSRSTDEKYCLLPDDLNVRGDTLVGVSENGLTISIYLPDLTIKETHHHIKFREFLGDRIAEMAVEFEIELDVDESFGNPDFLVAH